MYFECCIQVLIYGSEVYIDFFVICGWKVFGKF